VQEVDRKHWAWCSGGIYRGKVLAGVPKVGLAYTCVSEANRVPPVEQVLQTCSDLLVQQVIECP
jgi:hypothetical protein